MDTIVHRVSIYCIVQSRSIATHSVHYAHSILDRMHSHAQDRDVNSRRIQLIRDVADHRRHNPRLPIDRRDLKSVKLGDNPFRCDCDIVWMTDLGIDFSAGDETPACKSPDNLLGRPVSVLRSRELCPAPLRSGFRIERLILIFGLMIIVAVGGWYLWSRRAGATTQPHRCCISKLRNMYCKTPMPRFAYHNLVKDDEKLLEAGEFAEPTDAKPTPVEV